MLFYVFGDTASICSGLCIRAYLKAFACLYWLADCFRELNLLGVELLNYVISFLSGIPSFISELLKRDLLRLWHQDNPYRFVISPNDLILFQQRPDNFDPKLKIPYLRQQCRSLSNPFKPVFMNMDCVLLSTKRHNDKTGMNNRPNIS